MLRKFLGIALSLLFTSNALADSIDDFKDSWVGKALAYQRTLDLFSALKDNNILGTHNSYNSSAYSSIIYALPNQHVSIKDQLRMGSRFIELDAHWTWKVGKMPWNPKDLLLCHSSNGHATCSQLERYVWESLKEIHEWLDQNRNEVIILYIEDHTDGHHRELLNVLNEQLGGRIYPSNGCKSIPDTLTKAEVLKAGRQVVLWKDGNPECSPEAGLAALAYTGLGNLERTWEDRTLPGIWDYAINGGRPLLTSSDVVVAFKVGLSPDCNNNPCNIVNLDLMGITDGRLEAGVWSWAKNEPNNYRNDQDCAVQMNNGRWDDDHCYKSYPYACRQLGSDNWIITMQEGDWVGGAAACAAMNGDYMFDVPTNSSENEKLRAQLGGISRVWLNYNDIPVEGQWNPSFPMLLARNSGKCLDVSGGSTVDGANLIQWPCHGSDNQRWKVQSTDDGYIMLQSKHSGKCLDVARESTVDGANMIQWSCHGRDNQKWKVEVTNDGFVMLQSKHSGKCLDVSGGSTVDGANLIQWPCHGSKNQKFYFELPEQLLGLVY